MSRKHISLKTDKAALLLQLGEIPYEDAKNMTEDQIISLYQRDHNILHSSEHEDRDRFWNFTFRLIQAHRAKTRADTKIIAKSRRIRAWNAAADAPALRTGPDEFQRHAGHGARAAAAPRPARTPRKLRSRGFDKRFRRKMDGTVERR